MSAASTSPDVKQRGAHALGVLAGIVVGLIGLGAIIVLTPRVARVYPVSSDDATGVLEAASVLRGNVLLRGWTLSNVSFTTTDLPFYVAGVAINGMRPSLLRDVPVAVYVAAVALGAVLARGRKRCGRAALGVVAVLVLLCLPAGGLAEFVTKGYIRVGTTLGILAALVAIDLPEGKRPGVGRVALFAFFLTLTLVADSFALVLGVLPVIFVCALNGFSRFRDRVAKGEANAGGIRPPGALNLWAISFAALGSVAAARGISSLIEMLGGYRVVRPGLLEFLAYRNTLWVVSRNVLALGENLSTLYRCGFPAEFTSYSVVVSLPCLIGPLFLCWAFFRGAPVSVRGPRFGGSSHADFVGNVLWSSLVLCAAAYLASSIPKDRATARYMVPFFILGRAVLTGRVLADRVRDMRLRGFWELPFWESRTPVLSGTTCASRRRWTTPLNWPMHWPSAGCITGTRHSGTRRS